MNVKKTIAAGLLGLGSLVGLKFANDYYGGAQLKRDFATEHANIEDIYESVDKAKGNLEYPQRRHVDEAVEDFCDGIWCPMAIGNRGFGERLPPDEIIRLAAQTAATIEELDAASLKTNNYNLSHIEQHQTAIQNLRDRLVVVLGDRVVSNASYQNSNELK